ncbi:MAG: metallophosphoesterase [Spirosomataceae bacterium]
MTNMLLRRDFLKVSLSLLAIGCQKPTTKSSKSLRFAVASDGHFGQPKTDYEAYFEAIIKNLQTERAANGLDFVVFNGDLFHDDIRFLPEVKKYFDRLGFPYYVTRGNHDHVTPAQWHNTWGYDLNHAVDMGKNAILLADTSNEKGEYLCPDMVWLDQALSKLTKKENVFLFMHIPAKTWTEHGTVCPDLEKLFLKYPNLKATFHGHDHLIDEGKKGVIPAFFDGHFGGSWGVSYRGFRIVETQKTGQSFTYQYDPVTKMKVNEQVF